MEVVCEIKVMGVINASALLNSANKFLHNKTKHVPNIKQEQEAKLRNDSKKCRLCLFVSSSSYFSCFHSNPFANKGIWEMRTAFWIIQRQKSIFALILFSHVVHIWSSDPTTSLSSSIIPTVLHYEQEFFYIIKHVPYGRKG